MLAAGYKHFTHPHDRLHGEKKNGYQKCLREKGGSKRYFITIWEYDWEMFRREYPSFTVTSPFTYSARVQFHSQEGVSPTIDVDVHIDDETKKGLLQVEKLLAKLWAAAGKPYYEKYEDE